MSRTRRAHYTVMVLLFALSSCSGCRTVSNTSEVNQNGDCVRLHDHDPVSIAWVGYRDIHVKAEGVRFESISLVDCINITISSYNFTVPCDTKQLISVTGNSNNIKFVEGTVQTWAGAGMGEECKDGIILVDLNCGIDGLVEFRDSMFENTGPEKIKNFFEVQHGRLVVVSSRARGNTEDFFNSHSDRCAVVTVDKFEYNAGAGDADKIFDCHDNSKFVISNVLVYGNIKKKAIHAPCAEQDKNGSFKVAYTTFGINVSVLDEPMPQKMEMHNSLVMDVSTGYYGPSVLKATDAFFMDPTKGDYRLHPDGAKPVFDFNEAVEALPPTYDIEGNARNRGFEDVGAYQYRTECRGRKLPGFYCENGGTWRTDKPVVINIPTLWNGTYVVNANATISATQTFADDSVVILKSCATITGNVAFDSDTVKDGETRDVYLYDTNVDCVKFQGVNVEDTIKGCRAVSGKVADDKQGHLVVIFSVDDTCQENSGMSGGAIAAIVILFLFIIAVAVVIVVGLKVPQLRSKITPFKRKTIEKQQAISTNA